MYAKRILSLLVLLLALLGACAASDVESGSGLQPTPSTDPQSEQSDDLPAAVQAALAERAAATGIPADEIELISFNAQDWPDACLGLAAADEMCATVITPGYLVVVRAGDQVFNVRTNISGDIVRAQETADPATEYPFSVVNARAVLAQELGGPVLEIEVASFEQAEWSDSCLGLGGPAESCAAVITPGWRIMLNHAGVEYEVRTDMTGNAVRIADPAQMQPGTAAPLPEIGGAVAFYQRSGGIAGELVTVRIYADGTVEREVSINAPADSVETFAVDPAEVEQLLSELEQAGYAGLERAYLPEDSCCDRYFYLTAAEINGELVAVETMDATEETPDAVWDSIELLQQFIDKATAE